MLVHGGRRGAAAAVGVAGALLAGWVCDAVGAQRVLLAATAVQGSALLVYVLVRDPLAFTLVACAAVGGRAVQGTARSAVLAAAFPGPDRVAVRARLRVVTNVAIGLGTCAAAVALLVGSAAAYTVALVGTGLLALSACVPLTRLARTPAAPARPEASVGAGRPFGTAAT